MTIEPKFSQVFLFMQLLGEPKRGAVQTIFSIPVLVVDRHFMRDSFTMPIVRISTSQRYTCTPLTGLEFHLWFRHDKSINFSFCKGHFHWKILKSMGSFWRGTKTKTKTRCNEGHSPRGLCVDSGLPQNSCVANDVVPVIIKCLIVSAFSSLTIVTKGKQTTTDPYALTSCHHLRGKPVMKQFKRVCRVTNKIEQWATNLWPLHEGALLQWHHMHTGFSLNFFSDCPAAPFILSLH